MSNGDYEGLGSTRAEELRKSCALLGISEGRVHVVDDPGLQDGPLNHWDAEHIAFYLLPFIRRENIRAVVSFDERGVSGHPNHVALHAALAALRAAGRLPPRLRLLKLASVPLWRKFIGPLAALEPRPPALEAHSLGLPLVHRALQESPPGPRASSARRRLLRAPGCAPSRAARRGRRTSRRRCGTASCSFSSGDTPTPTPCSTSAEPVPWSRLCRTQLSSEH